MLLLTSIVIIMRKKWRQTEKRIITIWKIRKQTYGENSRKIILISTDCGEYCGYFVYDKRYSKNDCSLHLRELQLLNCDKRLIKQIIKYLTIEARRKRCSAVYIKLQNTPDEIDSLLHKYIKLCIKGGNNYFVKFRENIIPNVDPYSVYVPSELDPDVGFI